MLRSGTQTYAQRTCASALAKVVRLRVQLLQAQLKAAKPGTDSVDALEQQLAARMAEMHAMHDNHQLQLQVRVCACSIA